MWLLTTNTRITRISAQQLFFFRAFEVVALLGGRRPLDVCFHPFRFGMSCVENRTQWVALSSGSGPAGLASNRLVRGGRDSGFNSAGQTREYIDGSQNQRAVFLLKLPYC